MKNPRKTLSQQLQQLPVPPFKLEEVKTHLSSFLKPGDPCDSYAWETWKADFEKVQAAAAEVEIVHKFSAPEVIQAAFDYFKADLNENRALFGLKAARNARRLAKLKLVADLGRYDGRFIDDEDDEQVVAAIGAVVANAKSAKTRLLQQVVDASLTLAGEKGESGSQPKFPEALGEGIRDFQTDLIEFIQVNGDEGRKLVVRVCKDCDFARKISDDSTMPKCVKWLAGVVVDIQGKNKLPEQQSVIGFASK